MMCDGNPEFIVGYIADYIFVSDRETNFSFQFSVVALIREKNFWIVVIFGLFVTEGGPIL